MARRVSPGRTLVMTLLAWGVGFVIFFPILWMALASFKTELEAFATPPSFLFFDWTTENYAAVQGRSDYVHHAVNSVVVAGGSVLIALLSLIVLVRWKVSNPLLVAVTAVIGLIAFPILQPTWVFVK